MLGGWRSALQALRCMRSMCRCLQLRLLQRGSWGISFWRLRAAASRSRATKGNLHQAVKAGVGWAF